VGVKRNWNETLAWSGCRQEGMQDNGTGRRDSQWNVVLEEEEKKEQKRRIRRSS
jgi:hypothetical protein